MEASGDGGKIFNASRNIVGLLFKERSTFILAQGPPGVIPADRYERGARGIRPSKTLLAPSQFVDFTMVAIADVAGQTTKSPIRVSRPIGPPFLRALLNAPLQAECPR